MELKQIEENLKGITELVNRLHEEVEKMKQVPKGEECKKYQLNVYVDKPICYEKELGEMHNDEYWYIDHQGDVHCAFWYNDILDKARWENEILFKDKKSAETYQELLNDMKRLSKKFEYGEENYYIYYDVECNVVTWVGIKISQRREYCFTRINAEFILKKYGQEVLKNFIKYCK